MKIRLLQDFNAKTTTGARLIAAGTVLDLLEDKAGPLIRAGVAELLGQAHSSSVLQSTGVLLAAHVVTIRAASGELIHLTDDTKERDRLERAGLIVFSTAEAIELQKDPEAVQTVLAIKSTFFGADLLKINRQN